MDDGDHSPVVRRRELGAALRELRLEAGLTLEQVGQRLLCSTAKISRLETGHRGAALRDVHDLCRLYGAAPEPLLALARRARGRGWWQEYGELSERYANYIGLEADAIVMRNFEPTFMPGLLQTIDYTRAMLRSMSPGMTEEWVEQRVEVRSQRQHALWRELPLRLDAIIDESALLRQIGEPEVMREQIRHLIESVERDNVSVRVVPATAGAYAGLEGNFVILEFESAPTVVSCETVGGPFFVDRRSEVQRLQNVFSRLGRIALDDKASVEVLRRHLQPLL